MPNKKICVTCKKWFSCKSNLNRHVKSAHDSQWCVRRFAESEPGAVDKNNHPTTKIRKCIFTEDSEDESDVLLLSKQLEDMENVAMDGDGHLKYIKLKFNYLQRKISIH